MYRYFIETKSVIDDDGVAKEWNTYPLDRTICERQLTKSLKAIPTDRVIIRSWIEEVTE